MLDWRSARVATMHSRFSSKHQAYVLWLPHPESTRAQVLQRLHGVPSHAIPSLLVCFIHPFD